MSAIPTQSRVKVKRRQSGRCLRCQAGAASEYHHRRGRSVVDEHTHCPCGGIYLCHTCHRWVTEHPVEAMGQGWIVSRHQRQPSTIPVLVGPDVMYLLCNGEVEVW